MKIMRIHLNGAFCLLIALFNVPLGVARGQSPLAADLVENRIEMGRKTNVKTIWKSIEKNRSVRINRQGFGDTVGKTAIFLTEQDMISLEAAEANRRHQSLTVDDVSRWSLRGRTRVLLVAVAGGIYIANLPKWQAPAVHMTITVDGKEIQPESESNTGRSETRLGASQTGVVSRSGNLVTYTPLFESSIYDVARSRTWFSFNLPAAGSTFKVTVISSDGHEKSKEFSGAVLK